MQNKTKHIRRGRRRAFLFSDQTDGGRRRSFAKDREKKGRTIDCEYGKEEEEGGIVIEDSIIYGGGEDFSLSSSSSHIRSCLVQFN